MLGNISITASLQKSKKWRGNCLMEEAADDEECGAARRAWLVGGSCQELRLVIQDQSNANCC